MARREAEKFRCDKACSALGVSRVQMAATNQSVCCSGADARIHHTRCRCCRCCCVLKAQRNDDRPRYLCEYHEEDYMMVALFVACLCQRAPPSGQNAPLSQTNQRTRFGVRRWCALALFEWITPLLPLHDKTDAQFLAQPPRVSCCHCHGHHRS